MRLAGPVVSVNTGPMHPIEYVVLTIGTIVIILAVMALVAMVRSHSH